MCDFGIKLGRSKSCSLKNYTGCCWLCWCRYRLNTSSRAAATSDWCQCCFQMPQRWELSIWLVNLYKPFFPSLARPYSYQRPSKMKLQPLSLLPCQYKTNKQTKKTPLCTHASSVTYPPGSRAPESTAGPWKSRTCCCGWPERSATSFRHRAVISPSPFAHSDSSQRDVCGPKWLKVELSAAFSQQPHAHPSRPPGGSQDSR